MSALNPYNFSETDRTEKAIASLLKRMTLAEKIGQMCQRNASEANAPDYLGEAIRAGRIGSVLNIVDVEAVNELQRIAVEESRLGIPLLVARDVIHGFRTAMPIPLGLAATWNPRLVKECSRIAAQEAARHGINWTFAPMIDIARDPRWGRIAESFGEDKYLASALAVASVAGFQGDDLREPGAICACAKHFAGYGAVESGRDYATTNVPENELRNVYLRPFKAAVDAGVMTLMTSFSDLDGVPGTANEFLLRRVLRDEWSFEGLVVSDWDSVRQLAIHGVSDSDLESARQAAIAGVDMEMAGDAYENSLTKLVETGVVAEALIDAAASRILRAKLRLGLFKSPYTKPGNLPPIANPQALDTARQAAKQSVVLLKNADAALPLDRDDLASLAVVGPLADAPYEQLGTWVFDADTDLSVTPLAGLREMLGHEVELKYVRAMAHSRSRVSSEFDLAVAAAGSADATVVFLGEESILSGEAHSRADINLPGDQAELVRRIGKVSKKVILVIMAGRPLTLANVVNEADAIMYAWHPGTMAGPAIAELLFGVGSPSGKLPVSFPAMVGQIPIYYDQKNTGKPPTPDTIIHIDDIDPSSPQTSLGMTSFHLDAGYKPLFPFGFGLSYATFDYQNIRVDAEEIPPGQSITITAEVTNSGRLPAEEVAQLYVRDLVGSVTRPVRELKGFRRIHLEPGEAVAVAFKLHSDDLAFHGRDMQLATEPGEFQAWIGGSSDADLCTSFRIVASC